MAARDGVELSNLRMKILVPATEWWGTAEGDKIKEYQAEGMAKWNFPYAFSDEDFARGLVLNKANGYPSLVRGRATNKAKGHPNLVKGRTTNRARGYPELAKGRATEKANGYPGLTKGLTIQKENGFPNLAKGRAKGLTKILIINRANGYPNLVRARAANKTKGYPGLAEGPHIRWHVNRNKTSPACPLCRAGSK